MFSQCWKDVQCIGNLGINIRKVSIQILVHLSIDGVFPMLESYRVFNLGSNIGQIQSRSWDVCRDGVLLMLESCISTSTTPILGIRFLIPIIFFIASNLRKMSTIDVPRSDIPFWILGFYVL